MEAVPWAQIRLEASTLAQFADGSGVRVGLVGTGVSAKAPGLANRVTGSATTDCVGYGTFLAGLIAAAPQPNAGFSGVAPGSNIYAVRGTDALGAPSAGLVARGIREAVDSGAKVVEVAAALPESSGALDAAVTYAHKRDVVVVAPAEPDETPAVPAGGSTPAASYWPAALQGVVSVSDIDIDGKSTNDTAEPVQADLAAPGEAVTGIGPTGEGHYLGNGAAVASAFVAGAAALVRAYHPDLTASQVVGRLLDTSYPADVPEIDVHGALTGIVPARAPDVVRADRTVRLIPAADDGPAVMRAVVLTGCCALLGLGMWGGALLLRRSRANRAGNPPRAASH
ncbi:S8 family serine peptidase [Streptomyces sp. NPDC002755]